MKQKALFFILILTFLGVIDSGYLTYEHYAKTIPPCSTSIFIDCGKVLRSQYAVMFGIPVALIGLIHYSLLLINLLGIFITNKKIFKYFVVIQSTIGAFASVYFMYLQLFVIGSICLYCTFSAIISFTIFILAMIYLRKEKKELIFLFFAFFYQNILRKIFFLIDPEFIHETMLSRGEFLGRITPAKYLVGRITRYKDPALKQKIAGLTFETPVGLAAGFDYEAKLPLITPALGFGFPTILTITKIPS